MTRKQENILSMWTTTHAVLDAYEPLWSKLSAFAAAAERFRKVLDEFQPQARAQKAGTLGVTLDKQALRNKLCAAATQVAANIQAYATDHNNNTLNQEVHYTASDFTLMRDNILPVAVVSLLEHCKPYAKELDGYGVTKERLAQLQALLSQYQDANASPRIAIGSRKIATANIAQKIGEGNAALDIMDKLIGNFSDTDPAWVTAYRSARMVIDLGAHKPQKDKPANGAAGTPPGIV